MYTLIAIVLIYRFRLPEIVMRPHSQVMRTIIRVLHMNIVKKFIFLEEF